MAQTKNPTASPPVEPNELVVAWRLETLQRAGYPDELAEQIARSDADLHRAVGMLEQGCTPELAAQILV